MALQWANKPFQQYFAKLDETISDEYYTTRLGQLGAEKPLPMPGALRWEDNIRGSGPYEGVDCHGRCAFRWLVNRSGSEQAEGSLASFIANLAVTADSDGTTTTINDAAAFVADEEVFNIAQILNAASGAGAAPEGEWAIIERNTTGTLTVTPAFTTAVLDTDTAIIHHTVSVDDAASNDQFWEVAGVPLVAVADNYWAWYLCLGLVDALLPAGAGLTLQDALIAGTATVAISSTSDDDKIIGHSCAVVTNDIVRDRSLVYINVLHGVADTA